METGIFIQSAQNLRQLFHHPSDATQKIWSRLVNLPQRYSSLKGLAWTVDGKHFLHYQSMENIFVAQGRVTPKRMVWSGPKSNSSEMLWLSSFPASLTKIRSKMNSLFSGQYFPHYKSMGAISCHGNRHFYPICTKTLGSFSPTPVMRVWIGFNDYWLMALFFVDYWFLA